jgi:hypothetical protein
VLVPQVALLDRTLRYLANRYLADPDPTIGAGPTRNRPHQRRRGRRRAAEAAS